MPSLVLNGNQLSILVITLTLNFVKLFFVLFSIARMLTDFLTVVTLSSFLTDTVTRWSRNLA
jgi:hypothetical protein